jgi:3'-phosphoadenosine 5'-phosphosulfate sulfotransferase
LDWRSLRGLDVRARVYDGEGRHGAARRDVARDARSNFKYFKVALFGRILLEISQLNYHG